MTELFSVDNLRRAFSDWHRPVQLAKNPVCKLDAIARRISELPNQQPHAIAGVVHTVLLHALHTMQRDQWVHAEHYRDVVRGKSLLELHYVEQQSVLRICTEHHISQATCFRYFKLEFEALVGVLEAGVTNASIHKQSTSPSSHTQLDPRIPDLPADYLPRTALTDNVVTALTTRTGANTVALVGLPGAGKTTLATAIANYDAIHQHFPDGVLWMDMGQDSNAERCLREWLINLNVDATFGNPSQSREALSRALRAALSTKRVLIIIDDVWDVSAALALIVGSRASRHLVTTRSPALAYALASTNVIDVDELAVNEAKHLLGSFLQGSRRTNGELEQVALSDASVEGMNRLPLSVVLAGRHLRYLRNTQQHQRFVEVLKHLDTLALPQSADTLDSRIVTSVEALSEDMANAAACLAAFPPKPNSFRADDALAIADCTRNVLDHLIDAGLIESWRGRMTMHRAINHYFAERHPDILKLAARRMITHYSSIIHKEDSTLGLEDCANIATAVRHASTDAGAEAEVDLIWHAAWLFEEAGQLDDLSGWITHAKQRRLTDQQALMLSAEAARLTWLRGHADDSVAQLEACMMEARRLGMDDVYTQCEHTLSYIQVEHEEDEAGFAGAQNALLSVPPTARHTLAQSEIAAVRQLVMRSRLDNLRSTMARVVVKLAGNHAGRADVVLAGAVVAWLDYLNGDVSTTEARLREALQSPHALTHPLIAAITNGALARLCCFEGRYDEAETFAAKCIDPATREASPEFTALSHDVLGLSSLAADNLEDAHRWFLEGLTFTTSHRNPMLRSALLTSMCQFHLRKGDLESARQDAEQSMQIADLATDPIMRCASRTMASVVASASENFNEADRLFDLAREAGAIGTAKENRWSALQFHLHHAEHAMRKHAWDAADHEAKLAVSLAQQLCARAYVGRAWMAQAQIAFSTGDLVRASQYGQQGWEILTRIGHAAAANAGKWLFDNKLTGREE